MEVLLFIHGKVDTNVSTLVSGLQTCNVRVTREESKIAFTTIGEFPANVRFSNVYNSTVKPADPSLKKEKLSRTLKQE